MVSLLKNWGYVVTHRVLDTRKQGIPQSRPRFYLVGILRRAMTADFDFPADIDPEPIEAFLDEEDQRPPLKDAPMKVCKEGLQRLVEKGKAGDPSQETCCVDVFSTQAWSASMKGISPCLTATRCKQGGHFVSTRRGLMTRSEMCRLQGIPPGRFRPELIGISETHFLQAVGNAMSANVLARLFAHVLSAANLSAQSLDPPTGFAAKLR